MKSIIIFSIILVFIIAFSNGCQQREPEKKEMQEKRSLYITKTNLHNDYCLYRVFEDFNRKTIIDTICITCYPYDSISTGCVDEKEYRFVYDQEYHEEDTTMHWKPMYIERIPDFIFGGCIKCPEGKKRYKQTSYGYTGF